MNLNHDALVYLLQKIYLLNIQNLVEKNYTLNNILKELKEIGLETSISKIKKIENYIKINLGKEWDKDKGLWVDSEQKNT